MFGWLRSKKSRHRALAQIDFMSVRNSLITKASWEVPRARAAEAAYRAFLALMIDWPDETHVPTLDVDEFWHWHLLDSAKYERDCKAVFGKVIHHDPHLQKGTPAHTAAFAQTQRRLASRSPSRTNAPATRSQEPVSGTIPAACGGGVDPLLMTLLVTDDGGDARSDAAPTSSHHGTAEAPDPGPSHDAGSYGGSSYGDSGSSDSGGSSCSSGSSSSCASASCGGGSCGGGGGD